MTLYARTPDQIVALFKDRQKARGPVLAQMASVRDRCTRDGRGCLVWNGPRLPTGYGVTNIPTGQAYVHRLSYEASVGPIPEGHEIDHLCRNRSCVEPTHLEAVTHRENMRRSPRIAAQIAKTRCPQGHEYDEANTYTGRTGKRRCKECNRAYCRRSYAKRREAAMA